MYKIMKKLYKIRSQRDFHVDIKISCPRGCKPLACGYIHLLNHEKMCINQRLKRFFVNLQQMTILMRPSSWHKNLGPNGLSGLAQTSTRAFDAAYQELCLKFFTSMTADFNISSALRWVIQDQWFSGLSLWHNIRPNQWTMTEVDLCVTMIHYPKYNISP